MINLYRNMMAKVGAVFVLAWAFSIGTVSTADAAFILRLDDPNTAAVEVTVIDQGAGDINPVAGVITFSGSVGAYAVNVSTGVSKPTLGSALAPSMDLNSIDVTTGSGGLLNVFLTDTGFTGSGQLTMASGGTTAGSVTYAAWMDLSNVEFGMGSQIGILGPFGAGAFSGTTMGPGAGSAPYSLTERVSIVHTGNGATSFDATLVLTTSDVSLIPEPVTPALLGLALVGVAVFARRRTV